MLSCPWCESASPPHPSPTYHHACSPPLCLSPYFLLRFNRWLRLASTSFTVEPKVGCHELQDRWLPLWCSSPLASWLEDACPSRRPEMPMPPCWPGAEVPDWASWSLFWGAKCLKSGFWLKNLHSIMKAQNRSLKSTSSDDGISNRDHRDVHALGNRKPQKVLILRFLNQSLAGWLEAQRTTYEYSGMGPKVLPRPI